MFYYNSNFVICKLFFTTKQKLVLKWNLTNKSIFNRRENSNRIVNLRIKVNSVFRQGDAALNSLLRHPRLTFSQVKVPTSRAGFKKPITNLHIEAEFAIETSFSYFIMQNSAFLLIFDYIHES